MSRPDDMRRATGDLMSAVLVMLVYFAYMLTIGFAPDLFTAPIAEGSAVSVGLASGVVMAAFMVGFSAWYTHRRNSREGVG